MAGRGGAKGVSTSVRRLLVGLTLVESVLRGVCGRLRARLALNITASKEYTSERVAALTLIRLLVVLLVQGLVEVGAVLYGDRLLGNSDSSPVRACI